MNKVFIYAETETYLKYVGSGGGCGPIIGGFDMGSVPHLNQGWSGLDRLESHYKEFVE